jgi:hypothetical protein
MLEGKHPANFFKVVWPAGNAAFFLGFLVLLWRDYNAQTSRESLHASLQIMLNSAAWMLWNVVGSPWSRHHSQGRVAIEPAAGSSLVTILPRR